MLGLNLTIYSGIADDTNMSIPDIVLDTHVLVAALGSQLGASYQLLTLSGQKLFQTHISVALLLEYEDVLKRSIGNLQLSDQDVDDILDYLCAVSSHQHIHYLWRPYLHDPKDDMVLELAVAARCEAIVTFNLRDFRGIEAFGLRAIRPGDFLKEIGENP